MTILQSLESIRTPFLTVFESLWSFCGEEIFLIAILAVFYWCVDKKFARRIVYTIILSGNLVCILKASFFVPRPWLRYPSLTAADSVLLNADGYSFPSLHMCRITCLSGNFLYVYKQKWVKAIAVFVLLMTGIARMYLGASTLLDVLFSTGITLIISILVNRFIDGMVLDRGHYPIICALLVTLPMLSFILFLSQYYNGIIDYNSAASSVKMAGAGLAFAFSWLFEITYVKFNERCDLLWKQPVKAAIGVALCAALKVILDLLLSLFGSGFWPGDFMEYFIIVFVMMGVYPLCFKKYFAANY